MNKLFLDDLVERLETTTCTNVRVCEQKDIVDIISEFDPQEGLNDFPMVCFETSTDCQFNVPSSESKFLHSKDYNCTWIAGCDDDCVNFLICLKSVENTIHIEAFEVNVNMRGDGLGGTIVTVIESIAEMYYDYVVVSPFDTDAMNFWGHMEYKETRWGTWVKDLNS